MYLPTPISLTYMWNLGSFLGMALFLQIFSGLLLLLNYSSSSSFDSVMFILMEVNGGWLVKAFHANNASLIFLLLYLHLAKGLMMGSYRLTFVWFSGLVMYIMIMAAAFTGYSLLGSQMSLWAVIVITSLLGVIPYFGESILFFVWGGYSVSWVTLQLMMVAHFILPFLVVGVMGLHLFLLHTTGSSSSLGLHSGVGKIEFFPFYVVKDSMNIMVYMLFMVGMLLYPYSLGEVELFEDSNPMVSPVHIVPEWYFLGIYAILRSVPSKVVGVGLMIKSISVLFLYPLTTSYMPMLSVVGMISMFTYVVSMLLLMYMGMSPISPPFTLISMMLVCVHFWGHFVTLSMNALMYMYFSY